jgi:hypothetical protein
MEYLTDGNGKFVLNQQNAEEFYNTNTRTLKRWRDEGKITFREVVCGVYYYIIDINDVDAKDED